MSVYRSIALSHFTYSAPILASASVSTVNEMEAFQRRALKAIRANDHTTQLKFGITSIAELLRCQTKKIINRILSNKSHAVTSAIPRTKARSGRLETFKTNKARTTKYANSILQAHLRELRDGVSDLYTRSSVKTTSPIAQPVPLAKPKTKCPVCEKPFIHLSKHLAKSKCKQ